MPWRARYIYTTPPPTRGRPREDRGASLSRSAAVAVLGRHPENKRLSVASASRTVPCAERAASATGETYFQVTSGTHTFKERVYYVHPKESFQGVSTETEVRATHISPRRRRRVIPVAAITPRRCQPFFPRHLQRNTPPLSLPVDDRGVF